MSRASMLTSLRLKLQGDIAMARSNVDVFLKYPVGVGEHGDVMSTVEEQFAVIATAQDKLEEVKRYQNSLNDVDEWSKGRAKEYGNK